MTERVYFTPFANHAGVEISRHLPALSSLMHSSHSGKSGRKVRASQSDLGQREQFEQKCHLSVTSLDRYSIVNFSHTNFRGSR
jgi:hypothetical protein